MNADKLYSDLSNFYKDFPAQSQFIQDLLGIMVDGANMALQCLRNIKRNQLAGKVETYRQVPYFSTNVSDIAYSSARDIVSDTGAYVAMTLDRTNTSLIEKISFWENKATPEQRAQALAYLGKYKTFSLDLFPVPQDFSDGIIGTIVDSKVENINGEPLWAGRDYLIHRDRFYLLKPISELSIPGNTVVFRDTMIDFNASYEKLGLFLANKYNPIISRPEYTKINHAFLSAAPFGPTVKNIRQAISGAFEWRDMNVYDAFSKLTPAQAVNWAEGGIYGPFDFVVNMPSEYAADAERLEMIRSYMNLVRPAYASFFVQFTDKKDELVVPSEVRWNRFKLTLGKPGLPTQGDAASPQNTTTIKHTVRDLSAETMQYKAVCGVDSNAFVSFDGGFSLDGTNTTSSWLDDGQVTDVAQLTVEKFPAVPYVSSIAKTGSLVRATFVNNCTGIYSYQFLRDGNVVSEIKPASFGTFATLTQDVVATSGIHVYAMRSAYQPFITQPTTFYYSKPSLSVTIVA